MKAVIQRVSEAKVSVDGKVVSSIGRGLIVYLCVERMDKISTCELFANKLVRMRIFEDWYNKLNLSIMDVQGEVLLISQFTLAGEFRSGNRPSFSRAEESERAYDLYLHVAEQLYIAGVPIKKGVFGAKMVIDQQNEGPVTILWESNK